MTSATPDTTYNGWTNYETWAVALWIDNEAGSYETAREATREHWDDAADPETRNRWITQSQSQYARYRLAEWIKAHVEEFAPDLGASLYADLLTAALSEVEWASIADHWLSEIDGYVAKTSERHA